MGILSLAHTPEHYTNMVKHNNEIPHQHFKKDWQGNCSQSFVRTWFNQAGRKKSRRIAREKKAKAIFPRPVSGALRPAVQCPTQRYNFKQRLAPTIGICVDHRRKNRSEQSLATNVERLKAYMSNLILFPRKNSKPKHGDADKATIAAATQHKGTIMPVEKKKSGAFEMVTVTDEMKSFKAYQRLRTEMMNVWQVGPRIKKAEEAAKKAEEEQSSRR